MRPYQTRSGGVLLLFALMSICLINACSISKDQRQGSVSPQQFNYEGSFTTLKNIIVLPVKLEGETRSFLFDTGAQLNIIQRDSLKGKTEQFTGASKRKMQMGREIVPELSIGPIKFKNTHAGNGDLVGLKEQVPNFGGLIGQPIIRKANWLIDYPAKKITISSDRIQAKGFTRVKIDRKSGSPFVKIELLGHQYQAIIDMGSSATLSIPQDHPLAKIALKRVELHENVRNIYTLGGIQEVKELIGTVDEVKLGALTFREVHTDIRNTSKLRLGMRFFKDCQIYLDQKSRDYWIKRSP